MSTTNRRIFTTTSFLSLYHGAMDLGDHSVGIRNATLEPGNSNTRVGNNYMCVYRNLGLRMQS